MTLKGSAILALLLASVLAAADITKHQARENATRAVPGKVLGVTEHNTSSGRRQFLVKIRTSNQVKNVFVDAVSGHIDNVLTVQSSEKGFVFSAADAAAFAKQHVPGKVMGVTKHRTSNGEDEYEVREIVGYGVKNVFVNASHLAIDNVVGVPMTEKEAALIAARKYKAKVLGVKTHRTGRGESQFEVRIQNGGLVRDVFLNGVTGETENIVTVSQRRPGMTKGKRPTGGR